MRAFGRALSEQRSRVAEALQHALHDGGLEVEFALREKNRRLLALEEERRLLRDEQRRRDDELAAREALIAQLRAQLEREAEALALIKEGARARVGQLI